MRVFHSGRIPYTTPNPPFFCAPLSQRGILIFNHSGNCTKHNVRCDYMDQPEAEESQQILANSDLRMTPQIERDIQLWRETGVYPFPSLGVTAQPTLTQYSNTDLRLIHHISSIADQMQNAEAQQRSVWVRRVPLYVQFPFMNQARGNSNSLEGSSNLQQTMALLCMHFSLCQQHTSAG